MSASLSSVLTKLAGLALAVGVIVLSAATAAPPVRSVERFDARRYAGMWYELARMPNRLQAPCIADVTATYRPLDDGSMAVVHRCRDSGQRYHIAVGHAVPAAGDRSGARLRVSFLPEWLQWLPSANDDHWVVMLDPDYQYAVVSQPSRRALWILSRTPTLDIDTYDGIVAQLRAQKYPVDRLVPTPQRLQRPPSTLASRPRLTV
jgi:apolipoprotein D and lipocalin family protein